MKKSKLEYGHINNDKGPLPGEFKRLRENEIRHKENKKQSERSARKKKSRRK